MVTVTAYWRPSSMAEAFELLELSHAIVLAGGTRLEADPTAARVEVVDLQALGLDWIQAEPGDVLRIGAMVTLQELADSGAVPDVVREAARREQPSTLRTQGTVGGCLATGRADSELLAALLVHEAVVHLESRAGADELPLEQVLGELFLPRGQVVTGVTIRTTGRAVAARTARTLADRAIVAVYARTTGEGRRIAVTGVAPTPVLVQPGEDLLPAGDFRGSGEYRRHLAEVLVARVTEGSA